MIPDLSHWTVGTYLLCQMWAFCCACVLMALDRQHRRTAGVWTWLGILIGGPLVWGCFIGFTYCAICQRRRLSVLAQLDREGRAALQKGHHN